MTISGQPAGETVEDSLAWPEWLIGEQLEAIGPSNQPLQQEDKVLIPISPRKKPAT